MGPIPGSLCQRMVRALYLSKYASHLASNASADSSGLLDISLAVEPAKILVTLVHAPDHVLNS